MNKNVLVTAGKEIKKSTHCCRQKGTLHTEHPSDESRRNGEEQYRYHTVDQWQGIISKLCPSKISDNFQKPAPGFCSGSITIRRINQFIIIIKFIGKLI